MSFSILKFVQVAICIKLLFYSSNLFSQDEHLLEDGGASINNNIVSIDPIAILGIGQGRDISLLYQRKLFGLFRFEGGIGLWKSHNKDSDFNKNEMWLNSKWVGVNFTEKYHLIYRLGIRIVKPIWSADRKWGYHLGLSYRRRTQTFEANSNYPFDKMSHNDLIIQGGFLIVNNDKLEVMTIIGFGTDLNQLHRAEEFSSSLIGINEETGKDLAIDFGIRIGHKF